VPIHGAIVLFIAKHLHDVEERRAERAAGLLDELDELDAAGAGR